MKKTGVLLINLGTPQQPTRTSVAAFLREFLSDPRVIDLSTLLRLVLVNLFIIPFRSAKTTHAYQSIWTEHGSPLLYFSQQLCNKVQAQLGENYCVALGMRYGKPSIATALKTLQAQCDAIIILPLFPHYASATTGSVLEAIFNTLNQETSIPAITTINDFYAHPSFITAYSTLIQAHLQAFNPDYTLFSYHGLPMRQVQKSEPHHPSCIHDKPCPVINTHNRYCYRAQCYATSRLLAQALNLQENTYQVAFQSRLGKLPWTAPYIDQLLPQLRAQGIKRLAIVTPSFVVDCLETLEEIDIRLQKQWIALGGEAFMRVPCLNDSQQSVDTITHMILEKSH